MTDRPPGPEVRAPLRAAPEPGAPLPADLQLTAVSAHGWRVVDRRAPEGRPHRVLAFIELRRGGFEVMQLGAGFECDSFASLTEAVEFVCANVERLSRERG